MIQKQTSKPQQPQDALPRILRANVSSIFKDDCWFYDGIEPVKILEVFDKRNRLLWSFDATIETENWTRNQKENIQHLSLWLQLEILMNHETIVQLIDRQTWNILMLIKRVAVKIF